MRVLNTQRNDANGGTTKRYLTEIFATFILLNLLISNYADINFHDVCYYSLGIQGRAAVGSGEGSIKGRCAGDGSHRQ